MEYIRSLLVQAKAFWKDSSQSSKIGLVSIVGFCLIVLVGVGYWSSRPTYVPLVEDLSGKEAAQVIAKLESEGIAYKLNYTSSAVLVPQSKRSRAELSIGGIVDKDQLIEPDYASSAFLDPGTKREIHKRGRERQLAASIETIKSVQHAKVHLSIAENGPFIRDQKESSASVIITPKKGGTFTTAQAATVAQLISSSVSGLDPSNVQVMNDDGEQLAGGENEFGVQGDDIYIRRKIIERDLKSKAEQLLTRTLGPGRASVFVSAQINLTKIDTTVKTVDPANQVKTLTDTTITETTGSGIIAEGPAGTDSNVRPSGSSGAVGKTVLDKKETEKTEYAHGEEILKSIEIPDEVQRLSISAVVDLSSRDESDPAKVSNISQEQILGLIKAAVGFSEDRDDAIEVVVTDMPEDPLFADVTAIPDTLNQTFYLDLAKHVSLGVASLVALLIGVLVLRKMRPVTVTEKVESASITPERAKHISDLSAMARQHPEVLSKIVAAWANDSNTQSGTVQKREAA